LTDSKMLTALSTNCCEHGDKLCRGWPKKEDKRFTSVCK
jgi:hypothetical protein